MRVPVAHANFAEILLERQLEATEWIERSPPPDCDLTELQDYRSQLKAIQKSKAWDDVLRLKTPRFARR
jgi:hypothetical protein